MDETSMEYNKAIRNVVDYYASHKSDSFAVMYQEFDIDLTTFPVDGLSNIDCFHPRYAFLFYFYIIFKFIISLKINFIFMCSTKSHDFITKIFWNNLVLPASKRGGRIEWEDNVGIRCFEENDRINTNIHP